MTRRYNVYNTLMTELMLYARVLCWYKLLWYIAAKDWHWCT